MMCLVPFWLCCNFSVKSTRNEGFFYQLIILQTFYIFSYAKNEKDTVDLQSWLRSGKRAPNLSDQSELTASFRIFCGRVERFKDVYFRFTVNFDHQQAFCNWFVFYLVRSAKLKMHLWWKRKKAELKPNGINHALERKINKNRVSVNSDTSNAKWGGDEW